jgi:hypothetical protein
MNTVQVAIHDSSFADSIRKLLLHDGAHAVHLVDSPDLALRGVIVIDADRLYQLGVTATEQDRLVVLADKESNDLAKIWESGVRHVVFYGDPADTVRLAVLAGELRLAARNGESPH